ncbi:MAG: hypothetical protein JRF52_04965 [Deltaproteobacteria bacterium]|nr:hypothetical protein [Deltaproteobacteria bacterium]MBW2203450.1 hypothetical protein [Deltaproteobacteria bacterium]
MERLKKTSSMIDVVKIVVISRIKKEIVGLDIVSTNLKEALKLLHSESRAEEVPSERT